MEMLIVIVLVIGLAGIIGNQYTMIKKMHELHRTIREMKNK